MKGVANPAIASLLRFTPLVGRVAELGSLCILIFPIHLSQKSLDSRFNVLFTKTS